MVVGRGAVGGDAGLEIGFGAAGGERVGVFERLTAESERRVEIGGAVLERFVERPGLVVDAAGERRGAVAEGGVERVHALAQRAVEVLQRAGERGRALADAILGVKARGGIVAVVAHRPNVINAVDSVLVMMDGRMLAFGPKDEVLKRVLSRSPLPKATTLNVEGQGGEGASPQLGRP